jgi:8-oxo-dGTP pyrophosphatase MutT (NUDIX family)
LADANPPALPSATILLLRDGSRGLEVFMVQRHHRIDFATGAMVFPGGKVDPADSDPALAPRCRGTEALPEAMRPFYVAAIRETFEESGVLLARPSGEAALVGADRLARIEARHRDALNRDERTLPEIAEAEDLELALDLLVPFAHWITPTFMPKRFDTWFFLVPAPPDHVALHDGGESVDSHWVRPEDAVAQAERGERTIIFPTLMNVKKLGRSHRVADAMEAAARDRIVTVLPEVVKTDRGPMMRLPVDAGYDVVEAPLDDVR